MYLICKTIRDNTKCTSAECYFKPVIYSFYADFASVLECPDLSMWDEGSIIIP